MLASSPRLNVGQTATFRPRIEIIEERRVREVSGGSGQVLGASTYPYFDVSLPILNAGSGTNSQRAPCLLGSKHPQFTFQREYLFALPFPRSRSVDHQALERIEFVHHTAPRSRSRWGIPSICQPWIADAAWSYTAHPSSPVSSTDEDDKLLSLPTVTPIAKGTQEPLGCAQSAEGPFLLWAGYAVWSQGHADEGFGRVIISLTDSDGIAVSSPPGKSLRSTLDFLRLIDFSSSFSLGIVPTYLRCPCEPRPVLPFRRLNSRCQSCRIFAPISSLHFVRTKAVEISARRHPAILKLPSRGGGHRCPTSAGRPLVSALRISAKIEKTIHIQGRRARTPRTGGVVPLIRPHDLEASPATRATNVLANDAHSRVPWSHGAEAMHRKSLREILVGRRMSTDIILFFYEESALLWYFSSLVVSPHVAQVPIDAPFTSITSAWVWTLLSGLFAFSSPFLPLDFRPPRFTLRFLSLPYPYIAQITDFVVQTRLYSTFSFSPSSAKTLSVFSQILRNWILQAATFLRAITPLCLQYHPFFFRLDVFHPRIL
ncbi:hypothetical protein NMY22_g10094 [Coprinellus aureogranulatus]|nr:hypothetical protein NMY22_g10094 [Coprinellus aureogranulatus]